MDKSSVDVMREIVPFFFEKSDSSTYRYTYKYVLHLHVHESPGNEMEISHLQVTFCATWIITNTALLFTHSIWQLFALRPLVALACNFLHSTIA